MSSWQRWLCGWIKLAEAILTICTFSFFYPQWSTSFICWALERNYTPEDDEEEEIELELVDE